MFFPNEIARRLLPFLLAVILPLQAGAQGSRYTSVVVFGDSLSDTGNVAHLTQAKYGIRVPGPVADYTDGRFTDGFDTLPAARTDTGVWVEQLAGLLPAHPAVKDSLDGGRNYAFGFARTIGGTDPLTFGQGNAYSVTIDNVGQQITDYLATRPHITSGTLFVLWSGAIDVLNASGPGDIVDAAIHQAVNIQRLIDAGATDFLVLNLPPLGLTPRLNTLPALAASANEGAQIFNSTLSVNLDILPWLNWGRRLRIHRVDVNRLVTDVVAHPVSFGLMNVHEMAQGNFVVNPDTYLFWDDLHPTTQGHEIIAVAALKVVAPDVCARYAYLGMQPNCGLLP